MRGVFTIAIRLCTFHKVAPCQAGSPLMARQSCLLGRGPGRANGAVCELISYRNGAHPEALCCGITRRLSTHYVHRRSHPLTPGVCCWVSTAGGIQQREIR